MGLDCSHDAFHGAYSAFNRFRQVVCAAAGGSFPPHRERRFTDGTLMDDDHWYVPGYITPETHPGLYLFLAHSDCDGEMTPAECLQVAEDLEKLMPIIDAKGIGGGHIAQAGGYGEVARRFIRGCRQAAAANESLEFL